MNKAKKQALGRGLSALLKDTSTIKSADEQGAEQVVGRIMEIDINAIEINPFQPRTNFNAEALEELANSIRELGLIQPITVRKLDYNKYQLISGERRLRASKQIGLQTIPAYIRLANDDESLTMALVENIQRQDLDPIEIALSYQQLMQELNLTQDEVSTRVGKQRSTVANFIRLLKLDPLIQTGIRDELITMGHGRALISVEDTDTQIDLYYTVIKNNLSVRETEALVKAHQNKTADKPVTNQAPTSFEINENIKNNINKYFSTKVDVKLAKNGKGKISIPFHSEEDFNRIMKIMNISE
ncbi:ParB/RepB/Spo0J family partition protein [Flavobacterium agricola]|uniref:ParB/RepB/Spo0J family partition protein n=1 Tax=Flavobacterium agricola TaxID=2870839 RepID=A0ABY6LVX1_9FLAO|nr:ParB/RepB/Spo0J family partition protein [Flavobacterium agricola]UYW00329.1 ParB/RepB/Spo0J family partition protein [Flavobacterium agricola]